MYNFLTKCAYKKVDNASAEILNKYRLTLLKDTSSISIKDFGAGSRVFNTNNRNINAIAKNAGITKKRQRLLLKITSYFQSSKILELGTSLGLATAALSKGNPNALIKTVEGCPATALVAEKYFKQFSFNNIDLINARFEDFFISEAFKNNNFDLVYVDGNHNKEHTLDYFEKLLPHVHNDSVIIFDDIYWSKSMTQAWQQIITHPQITVSIDSFYWGLVFFRKEQNKEHFTLRL
ncbi:O-methyltransferase [Patiriisocius marinistellae]|uniref:O-methyltransferase n=1 Tax=Patiriisocius marinistellae TaxID=2494560 RepID=A0A5J4FZZ1_9FLAO|nr:class I SAM-dependent methyltransferase [Patiriisocius marinistellae]GEQ86822.1 O-methyltransferase [Patiriisocius marinistellae]